MLVPQVSTYGIIFLAEANLTCPAVRRQMADKPIHPYRRPDSASRHPCNTLSLGG